MPRFASLFTVLLVLLTGTLVHAAPTFPPLTGRVVDDAHVLSPQTQAELTQSLSALEQRTSRQLVVVTLPSLGGYEIDDYGYQLLRAWGIGQKATNNGAVFIVVPSEHKVRIEVGYGLEATLTDALSSLILQRQVLPRFRDGDIQGGVVAGTEALVEQLSLDPSEAEQKAAQAAQQIRQPSERGNPLGAIVPILVIFFVASSLFGRRGRGGGLAWILPLMLLGGRRGWGGGDFGGGGFDGGGFGGGGGSGGGGGASGSW